VTVPASVSPWQYLGNGAATSFAYTAKVFAKTDLVVTRTSAAFLDTLLVVDVDYTVTGVGLDAGGDVVYPISGSPLPIGEKITIERVLPLTQLLDLRNQGPWHPENHEDAYDRLTMIAQQITESMERSIRAPASDGPVLMVLPAKEIRALQFAFFDSDGNIGAAGGDVPGSVIVSAFAQTVLDDASADFMLATLGVSAYIRTLLNDASAPTARATLGAQQDVITTRGDIVRGSAAAVAERLAISGTPEALLQSNTLDPVWGTPVPQGYRYGLELSRTGVATVSIAAGVAKAIANTWTMRLAAAFSKTINAAWVAGTGLGGRGTAALLADTWYHVFLIFNAGTGALDAGFDTSPTAANLLAASGFGSYRRLGSVLSNGAATDVIDFLQTGQYFFWKTPLAVTSGNVGTTAVLRQVDVPPDVKPLVFVNLSVDGDAVTADSVCYASSPDVDDVAPSDTASPLGTLKGADTLQGKAIAMVGPIRVDASRQIRLRTTVAATPVRTVAIGWIDPLP